MAAAPGSIQARGLASTAQSAQRRSGPSGIISGVQTMGHEDVEPPPSCVSRISADRRAARYPQPGGTSIARSPSNLPTATARSFPSPGPGRSAKQQPAPLDRRALRQRPELWPRDRGGSRGARQRAPPASGRRRSLCRDGEGVRSVLNNRGERHEILRTDKFRCSSAVRPFNSPDRPLKFRCSAA